MPRNERTPPRQLGAVTASLTVIASMIGTGVFTTTGFLVRDVGSPWAIVIAWLLGGLLALCGALCYAELASALPHNGGEYHLLSRVYHPSVGFAAGWISLVVGFSAPTAAAALAGGRYLTMVWPSLPQLPFAVAITLLLSAAHAWRVRVGSRLQNVATAAQVALIVVFIIGGGLVGEPARLSQARVALPDALLSPALPVGLIYIAFAYSGWNAAAYLVGELERPGRLLPRACLGGVVATTVLYVALNLVFLMSAPAQQLAGRVEVAAIAAEHLFGSGARPLVAGVISLGLLTTVSALLMTGSRVYEAMGADYPRLRSLDRRAGPGAGPGRAIALQALLSVALMLVADVDALLTYCGFTLSVIAALTAVGVIVLRLREPALPRPYRTWGYPITPLLFAALSAWMVGHAVLQRPVAALAGGTTLALGLVGYAVLRPR